MFDASAKPGRYLCHTLSIGRLLPSTNREWDTQARPALAERPIRKMGRREAQGLTVLFMVNPTGERASAEEEVASLCTTLPESISRIILYRQQANQLEMRMRINAETPQVLHYAGPLPLTTSAGDSVLALPGNSRLDSNTIEQI